jgi:hypothetical protein
MTNRIQKICYVNWQNLAVIKTKTREVVFTRWYRHIIRDERAGTHGMKRLFRRCGLVECRRSGNKVEMKENGSETLLGQRYKTET